MFSLELDDDRYPTEESLVNIKNWPTEHMELLFEQLLDFFPCDGMGRADFAGGIYEFATGGWSGCEDIIDALRRNKHLIWMMTWVMSRRGGLHQFELPSRFRKGARAYAP